MRKWDELLNDDLWNSFRVDFVEWIDENFKLASITTQKKFRAFLWSRNVWVMKSSTQIIAKSFAQVIEKNTFTSWIEEEIRRCLTSKTFIFHVIIHFLKTNFERNSKDYSWQASQSKSKHSESSRSTESRIQSTESYLRSTQKSSSRERSMQQRSVTREMQQSSIRSLHQSLIKQSSRESSLTRNFLRQSSLFLSQSKQNSYSRQSFSSENLYSDSSSENLYSDSSSENLYIRHSEKKSMLKQSF